MSDLAKLKEVQDKIAEAQAKVKKAFQEAETMARGAFDEGVNVLFEQFPILKRFSWTQYTPYFNDGDECTFGVNNDYPKIWYSSELELDLKKQKVKELANELGIGDKVNFLDSDEDYDDDDYDEFSSWEYRENPTNPKNIAGKAVVDFLTNFEDDLMRSMFGDHVEITVDKSGAVVDEYSHD